jgi:hypothetical protein
MRPREQGRAEEGPFRVPPFAEVIPYRALGGPKAGPEYLYGQIVDVRENIKNFANARNPLHDVVIIYFEGREDLGEEGSVFVTGPGQPRHSGIVCNDLVRHLSYTPGAHLLLLDVERLPANGPQSDKIRRWREEYPDVRGHAGVVRYAWAGKGPAPAGARLGVALAKGIGKASRLRQLVEEMGKLVARFQGRGLLVAEYVPDALGDLVVGRP